MEQTPRRLVGGDIDGFIRPRPKLPKDLVDSNFIRPKTSLHEPVRPEKPVSQITSQPKTFSSFGQPNELNSFQPLITKRLSRKHKAKKSRLKRWQNWSLRKKVFMTVLAFLLVGFSLGAYYGASVVASLDKAFHGNVFSDVHALFSSTVLKGEAQGRVNILVAGDSVDDPGHLGAQLSDSIMVLSINTRNHTAFLLSIPRDLWVYIPQFNSYQKINAANDISINTLQQIVQTDLGIPIDYSVLVDYGAFRDAVDAVGGITIDIQSPDPRGLYDAYTHLKLPNGEVTLTGQEALNLARARGDGSAGDVSYGFPGTDFTRTMYQRKMVIAIVKKADTIGVLANPIKISSLVNAVGTNVKTDLTLQDVLRLAQIGRSLNLNSIGSYTYSSTSTGTPKSQALLTDYTDPSSGEESLIPSAGIGQYGQLQNYYQQLTSSDPIVKEDASIVILNGTNVNGLAKKAEGILQANKLTNITIANANSNYAQTMIVNQSNGQAPATRTLLQNLFPGTITTSTSSSKEAEEANNYTAQFVVILGQNSANIKQP
jgi:LCP family protein required for cell wall assembly